MRFLEVRIATAAVSLTLAVVDMARRARRVQPGLEQPMIRSAIEQFLPGMAVGVLLTSVLLLAAPQETWILPGLWQLIFSLGVFSSCHGLPRATFGAGLWHLVCRSGTNLGKACNDSRFAYGRIGRIIHKRARLSVLTSLITHAKGLPNGKFNQLCALTDGNLNRHLTVLEVANLLAIATILKRGRPQSVCRITAPGGRRYGAYLAVLQHVVPDASSAIKAETPRAAVPPRRTPERRLAQDSEPC